MHFKSVLETRTQERSVSASQADDSRRGSCNGARKRSISSTLSIIGHVQAGYEATCRWRTAEEGKD